MRERGDIQERLREMNRGSPKCVGTHRPQTVDTLLGSPE